MNILTLFLTSGKSLRSWQAEGLLSREILVYRELLLRDVFDRIQIFSYDAADRAFVAELAREQPWYARIDILAPPAGRRGGRWGISGVLKHRAAIANSRVLKTNQVSGSWAATLASWLTGVPLVFRMGYILSRRFALNGEKAKARVARLVERAGMRRAARVVVTSEDAAQHFRKAGAGDKVVLLPTYVDVTVFDAKTGYDFTQPLIAVGRMRAQKNLPALFHACASAGAGLTLIGKGEQESELRALAAELGIAVTFAGQCDNVEVAAAMARHSMFILPSLHEGLPKVLIEAMATGLVCIGTPIDGTTDLIEDGVTGYLSSGFDAAAIAAAITRARGDADPEVGRRARARIVERFGLDRYVAAEAAIYAALA